MTIKSGAGTRRTASEIWLRIVSMAPRKYADTTPIMVPMMAVDSAAAMPTIKVGVVA